MKLARAMRVREVTGALVVVAAVASGCDAIVGVTDVSFVGGGVDGGTGTGRDAGKRADAGKDATTGSGSGSGSATGSGSGSSDGSATDSGNNSGEASCGSATGDWPCPAGSPATATVPHNFAVHRLYFGDTDPTPSFTADPNAWKSIGFNLDGLVTTAGSTDVCTPHAQGLTSQQVDGNGGIDNAFAGLVNNVLSLLIPSLSSTVSQNLAIGMFTLEIDTVGLSDTPSTQTSTSVTGQVFPGASYTATGGVPAITGVAPDTSWALGDNWPVNGALLSSVTPPLTSNIRFPKAYITNGTWVSGIPITVTLTLPIKGLSLVVNVHAAITAMPITIDAEGQYHTRRAMIGGVIETSEIVASVSQVAAAVNGCGIVGGILGKIEGYSDIVIDTSSGAVSNPAGTPCNGISIGFAFDADEIAQPSTVAAPVDAGAAVAPCPSSGGDAGPRDGGSPG